MQQDDGIMLLGSYLTFFVATPRRANVCLDTPDPDLPLPLVDKDRYGM